MANSDHYPPSGKTNADTRPYSGVAENSDPTAQPGQYPPGGWGTSIFGGTLPTGTGAPGTSGDGEPLDATNERGQTRDGYAGIDNSAIVNSGAPGSQGAVDSGGGAAITYTMPQDGIGPYANVTVNDSTSGPTDSTQANDQGYATGGPQFPGNAGNEPQAGSSRYQPGGGHVLRGGRAINP
jgi:hypothetical protein